MGAVLSALCPLQPGPPWVWESEGDACLYINYYLDAGVEQSKQQREALETTLGSVPDVSVSADVAGRHQGGAEVRAFVEAMLVRFGGVAMDDYTSHAWTLAEIQAGARVEDHLFFDYLGWYKELKK